MQARFVYADGWVEYHQVDDDALTIYLVDGPAEEQRLRWNRMMEQDCTVRVRRFNRVTYRQNDGNPWFFQYEEVKG